MRLAVFVFVLLAVFDSLVMHAFCAQGSGFLNACFGLVVSGLLSYSLRSLCFGLSLGLWGCSKWRERGVLVFETWICMGILLGFDIKLNINRNSLKKYVGTLLHVRYRLIQWPDLVSIGCPLKAQYLTYCKGSCVAVEYCQNVACSAWYPYWYTSR